MSGYYATVSQKLTGFRMTRVITNKDPVNKAVTFTQGLVTMTVYLDPWPDTDEEIESQATAKLPSYTGGDPSQIILDHRKEYRQRGHRRPDPDQHVGARKPAGKGVNGQFRGKG